MSLTAGYQDLFEASCYVPLTTRCASIEILFELSIQKVSGIEAPFVVHIPALVPV